MDVTCLGPWRYSRKTLLHLESSFDLLVSAFRKTLQLASGTEAIEECLTAPSSACSELRCNLAASCTGRDARSFLDKSTRHEFFGAPY